MRPLKQTLAYFTLATFLSIALIYFLNMEIDKRHHHTSTSASEKSDFRGGGGGYIKDLATGIHKTATNFLTNFLTGIDKLRSKRSITTEEHHKLRHQEKHLEIAATTTTTKTEQQICYDTEDVLLVVAMTCILNFGFVMVVWGAVWWVSAGGRVIGGKNKWGDFDGSSSEDEEEMVLRKSLSMDELRYYR